MSLSRQSCVPCQGEVAPLGEARAREMLEQTPGWELTTAASRIERRFKFKNFAQALAFVNRVGEVAEDQSHHPDITFGWGYATVQFYTHKIRGLHDNDFVMAAKVNELYESP